MFATLISATLVSLLAVRGVHATDLIVATPQFTQVISVAPPFLFMTMMIIVVCSRPNQLVSGRPPLHSHHYQCHYALWHPNVNLLC